MDYQLARSLKDAGFPFQEAHHEAVLGKRLLDVMLVFDGISYYSPTLSELIDTFQGRYKYDIDGLINDAQFVLTKTVIPAGALYIAMLDGDWVNNDYQDKYKFACSTPEEAVARLWLALNNN